MKIKINFQSKYYNGHMRLNVLLNDTLVATWKSREACDLADSIEFDANVTTTQPFRLDLQVYGKSPLDTVYNNDELVKDKALVVDSVWLGENELIHELNLVPFYTRDTVVTNTRYLGFNGTYSFDITPTLSEWMFECKNKLLERSQKVTTIDDFINEIMS